MSYDLHFQPEGELPTCDDVMAYFADRAWYTVESPAASYHNDDTGVYFSFEYCTPDEGDLADFPPITFNMNYYRPHYFGLEAALELETFVRRFDLSVSDPQVDGMGDGPFTVEGFLRGWNSGNRVAYQAILSSNDLPAPLVYSTDALERIWKWNYARQAMQEQAGESMFVPKVMFRKHRGRACSAVVWPDACPVLLPESDLVLLYRVEFSADRGTGDSSDFAVVTWKQIASIVSSFTQQTGDLPYYEVSYEEAPEGMIDFVRSQPAVTSIQRMALANDDVLDEDLVQRALEGGK
jgi:hypothetical protein